MVVDEYDNIEQQQELEDSNQQSQNSELTQEQNDNVMSLPSNQGGDLKVIESKTICYCSNFDLNINEWFNEYENIEIFKINMKKNLGSMWLKYFNEAIECKDKVGGSLREDHFFTRIFNFYLVNYYSPAQASAFKMTQHSEQMFEKYYQDLTQDLLTRGYRVIDQNLLKSLIHTFYFVSIKEYENILKKIESDQKYQIQLTEKALAQYDEQQRREALTNRERALDQQRMQQQKPSKHDKDMGQQQQQYLGNTFPGFSIIKDRVIKPLLIATEKVVEYYFQEEKKEPGIKTPAQIQATQAQMKQKKRSSAGGTTWTTLDDTLSDESGTEFSKIRRKMKRLDINSDFDALSGKHLESPKSQRTLKKRRFRQLERRNFDDELDPFSCSFDSTSKGTLKGKTDRKSLKLNEKMLRKASATVDLISQKVKAKNVIQETVSATFVTNVIELTKEALEKLQQNDKTLTKEEQKETYDMNLRFIKPSHKFYNEVMCSWFKFIYILNEQREDKKSHSNQLIPSEIVTSFIAFSINQLTAQGMWVEGLTRPLECFCHIIVKEYCLLYNHLSEGNEDEQSITHQISMCSFFDNVKSNLLKRWEKDIIQKSSQFQQQQTSLN